MKLGVALPIVDIGGGPEALREFVQAAEDVGYQGTRRTRSRARRQC